MIIKEAVKRYTSALMGLPHVFAVGRGPKWESGVQIGTEAIICTVYKKLPESQLISPSAVVPKTIRGIPTDVIEREEPVIHLGRTDKHDPMPMGVSIGELGVSAGTSGLLVIRNGVIHILGNNHVLADSNDAPIGSAIVHPGVADGGRDPVDRIALLEEFVTIAFEGDVPPTGCPVDKTVASIFNGLARVLRRKSRLAAMQPVTNLVDAAIARPIRPDGVIPDIFELGCAKGRASADIGMEIQKSGRSSATTTGVIEQVDVTVRVGYGGSKVAVFTDQLMAGAMSKPGDSGSIVLNMFYYVIGLLFAGSKNTTIINRIENVFDLLGLDEIVLV